MLVVCLLMITVARHQLVVARLLQLITVARHQLVVARLLQPITVARHQLVVARSFTTTDNSGSSSTGGGSSTTTDNSGSSSTGGGSSTTTDNSGSSSTGGGSSTTTDNSGSSSTGGGSSTTTDNSAILTTTSTASDNTGNVLKLSAEDIKGLLDIHNRERAANSVPPLVWSDKLAADAQVWADHLATLQVIVQSNAHDPEQLAALGEGENVALRSHVLQSNEPLAQMAEKWVAEKTNYHEGSPTGSVLHYAQMVSKDTTQFGCATASGGQTSGTDILDCRYTR